MSSSLLRLNFWNSIEGLLKSNIFSTLYTNLWVKCLSRRLNIFQLWLKLAIVDKLALNISRFTPPRPTYRHFLLVGATHFKIASPDLRLIRPDLPPTTRAKAAAARHWRSGGGGLKCSECNVQQADILGVGGGAGAVPRFPRNYYPLPPPLSLALCVYKIIGYEILSWVHLASSMCVNKLPLRLLSPAYLKGNF